jgi:hypothetical protein
MSLTETSPHAQALGERMRAFSYALVAALATDVSLMIVHFVNQWPTSDVRVHAYTRFAQSPGQVFIIYGTVLFAAGSIVVRLAGWRGLYTILGTAAAALLTLMLFAAHAFSLVVWTYRSEVTNDAMMLRIAFSFVLLILGFMIARRGGETKTP